VRKDVGEELYRLQQGLLPLHGKAFASIKGVFDLKIRYDTNAYRTMYCSVTKDTVSVLHCFIKRSQRTSNTDISITTKRYQRVKEQNRNA